MGSDQLVQGPEDLDGADGYGDLDATSGGGSTPRSSRTSVLAEDGPRRSQVPDAAISVHLQTDELPFQQPNPRAVPVEPAVSGWRTAIAEVGRWPFVVLLAAAVLVAIFASFIAGNDQSPTGDREAAEAPAAVESASVAGSADQPAGAPTQAQLGSERLTAGGESDDSARSTGTLGPGEGSGFYSGQVVEPDRSLAGTEIDWTPTTVKPASTSTPSTAATPPTEASSTTTPESTSTVPSTATTAEPSGPWVRAIGPGSADSGNPTVLGSRRVTLQAEGSGEKMRYRFFVFVRTDDGDWRQIGRSRWRSKSDWKIDVGRYEGRTLRWTVVGVSGSRNLTGESAPLHFRVGDGKDANDDDRDGEPAPDAGESETDG